MFCTFMLQTAHKRNNMFFYVLLNHAFIYASMEI